MPFLCKTNEHWLRLDSHCPLSFKSVPPFFFSLLNILFQKSYTLYITLMLTKHLNAVSFTSCGHNDLAFLVFSALMCALDLQGWTCVWSLITAVSTSVRARLVLTTVCVCLDTHSTRTARPAHVCSLANDTSS